MNRFATAAVAGAVALVVAVSARAEAQPPAADPAPASAPAPAAAAESAPARAGAPARRRGKPRKVRGKGKLARGKGARPVAATAAAGKRPAWLSGDAPAGWSENPALSRSVGTALRQARPFGELAARAGAIAYVQGGVGAFYLAWLESDQAAPDAVAAVRAALDHLRESRVLSSPQAHSTEELSYGEELDGGMARARLEWRHLSNETASQVRTAVWLSADGKPRLASAECVASTSAGKTPTAVDKACRDALATFAVAVPAAERGALAALPAGRPVAEPREPDEPQAGDAPGSDRARPPSMGPARPGAGDHVLYTGPAGEESEGSRQWMILIGVGLLAAAAYLTLRSRRRSGGGDAEADEPPRAEPEADAEAEPDSEAEADREADATRDPSDEPAGSDPEKSR
jgi:hypothetical protein